MIKTLSKLRLEGKLNNLIKTIYKKSTVNIILHVEKIKGFPLRPGARQGILSY